MLSYTDRGKGLPILLLHAFPLSSRMWEGEILRFQDQFRMIVPDLPGFGQSPRQEKPSIAHMAKSVAALLDDLNVQEQVVVCGLSMGGYVLFEFLNQFPSRVRAAGLFSTRAAADSTEVREKRFKTIEMIDRMGPGPFIEKILPNLLGKTTVETNLSVVEKVRGMILQNDAGGITDALRAMAERRDFTQFLSTIKIPVLVLSGEEDTFVPVKEAEAMHLEIKGSEFKIIPKAGHLINFESPGLFQQYFKDFLGRL